MFEPFTNYYLGETTLALLLGGICLSYAIRALNRGSYYSRSRTVAAVLLIVGAQLTLVGGTNAVSVLLGIPPEVPADEDSAITQTETRDTAY